MTVLAEQESCERQRHTHVVRILERGIHQSPKGGFRRPTTIERECFIQTAVNLISQVLAEQSSRVCRIAVVAGEIGVGRLATLSGLSGRVS